MLKTSTHKVKHLGRDMNTRLIYDPDVKCSTQLAVCKIELADTASYELYKIRSRIKLCCKFSHKSFQNSKKTKIMLTWIDVSKRRPSSVNRPSECWSLGKARILKDFRSSSEKEIFVKN